LAVFFAAVFLAVFLAGAATPGPSDAPAAGNTSLSLRTTGASMVDDADLVYSPISLSLAITALLSTPSSLASS
jgi:hypothetical protein